MTTKTIAGTYSSGYLLNSSYSAVTITSTGSVGGFGLLTTAANVHVNNSGHLQAAAGAAGVSLLGTGEGLTNHARGYIGGGQAIGASGAGANGNAGGAGAYAKAYGHVVSSGGDMVGGAGGMGLTGTIGGQGGVGGDGASLLAGGLVQNSGGSFFGGRGGDGGASTYDSATPGGDGGDGGDGVAMAAYGVFVNSSGGVTGGYGGQGGPGGAGAYVNVGGSGGDGVHLAAGGIVHAYGGFIEGGGGGLAGAGGGGGYGGGGVVLQAFGYVANRSLIVGGQGGTGADGYNQYKQDIGRGGAGIVLQYGGTVTNYALISGGTGGSAANGARAGNGGIGVETGGGAVLNYGTINGGGGGYSKTFKSSCGIGVELQGYGVIDNGDASMRTATIEGNGGNSSQGANYNGTGVFVPFQSGVTVTNWGTLSGTHAVFFGSSPLGPFIDTLVAEAGCVFNGTISGGDAAIAGGAGLLELGAGSGTLSGLDAGGNVTVTGFLGAGSNTTFQNFGTLEIASGGGFATTTTGTIASGKTLIDNGALTDGGTLTVNGSIGGSGTLTINGRLTLLSGSALTVGTVYVGARAARVTIASNIVEAGFWDQYLGTLAVAPRKTFELTGATDYLTGRTTTNRGNLEYAGSGQLYIQNALVNDSQLIVQSGQITLETACTVSGSGDAVIKGGTLAAYGVFDQNVFFEGAGTLGLGRSQSYTAQVVGFSTTGTDVLDLGDIGFVSANEATFSGTASGGVLTVSDGTHTAHINLAGNFLSSTFVCASDGSGGVLIHDPTQGASAPPSTHALVAAMAAMGAPAGTTPRAIDSPAVREPLFARPHVLIA